MRKYNRVLLVLTLSLLAFYGFQHPAASAATNLAPAGTGYRWHGLTSLTSNSNRASSTGINDGNLTTDVPLTGSTTTDDPVGTYEAAGVIWTSAQTISSINYINGSFDANSNGVFTGNFGLQFTSDGTTWTASGWSYSPSYPYDSPSAARITYTFIGASVSVLGIRVVGQVHASDNNNSWHANTYEVQAFGASASPTNTPSTGPTATLSSGNGSPYGGTPAAVPGKIEAENFNTGGEGVAYHDADTVNSGGAYRASEGVDIQTCTDTGCGYNVGWDNAGEWRKYTVNVQASGTYNAAFRIASNVSGGSFHMEVDNVNVTGSISIPNTGGWQIWTTVTVNAISLSGGQHVLKVYTDVRGANYNWFSLTAAGSATSTPVPTFQPPTNTPKPTATTGSGGGRKQSTYFTSYGYNDNDDGNGHYGTAVIAYPDSHHAIATEGKGTYDDPITFATDEREIPPHTMIYVPYLQKYFYMEDGCAECTTDWNNGQKWRTDLFMGPNNALQPEPALDNCEAYITRNDIMYIGAGPGYPVDTTPLFINGQCTAVIH